MGSNKNRHFERVNEWGSKARKEEARTKKRTANELSISDSAMDGAPTRAGKRRKKDTRKWCRGKVGVEHDWIVIETVRYFWYSFRTYRCNGCQKTRHERLN